MARRNPWWELSLNAARLGLESQTVIALRMMQAAAGGARARRELSLMVVEKVEAGMEVAAEMMNAGPRALGPGPSSRAVALVRRKVRANRRRLMKDV